MPKVNHVIYTYVSAEDQTLTIYRKPGAYLGVSSRKLESDEVIPDLIPTGYGVAVTEVQKNSPAASADIREGDIIVMFKGKHVFDLFGDVIAQEPGDTVKLVVLRDNEYIDKTVTLSTFKALTVPFPERLK